MKLKKKMKELENATTQLKRLAIDQKTVTIEKDQLEEENEQLQKNLRRLTNIDDIHIEIDMLSQSQPGIEIIKHKYGKIFY